MEKEIDGILSSGRLLPGAAAKLKGKLMFAASQLWGKVGRAFLRPLSERQYSRECWDKLDRSLVLALQGWLQLLKHAPRRTLAPFSNEKVEWVLFTDGYTPDQRFGETGDSMIGAVLFKADGSVPPRYLSEVVPAQVVKDWRARANQISMVELIAPIVAFHRWKDVLEGRKTLVLIDNESAEGALVKGYSSKEDACEALSHFWLEVADVRGFIYIERIPTDANPADLPSRPNKCDGLEKWGWVRDRACEWPEPGSGGRAWVKF